MRLNSYKKLRYEIRKYKSLEANEENGQLLDKNINALDKYLFVPEVISVHGNKSDYKKFSRKGFYFGDTYYTRYCSNTNSLKRNTVLFVQDDVNKHITELFRCGCKKDIEKEQIVIPEKYGAYMGLTTSGVQFIEPPANVCVIPDFKEIAPDDLVNYVSKNTVYGKTEYTSEIKKYSDTGQKLNSFDGMGLIDVSAAEAIASKELGLDYVPSAFVIRAVGVKGLLVTFPIREFAMEKEITKIVNLKGEDTDISKVDIILTASQWKYHNLFDNDFDAFTKNEKDKGLVWGVQRVSPKTDKDEVKLNYQLIQTSNLQNNDDIEELLKPTKEHFRKLIDGDIFTNLKFMAEDELLNDDIDNLSVIAP